MSNHKSSKNSKLVGLTFGLTECKEIDRRAEAFGMSRAGYLKAIVRQFFKSGDRLLLTEE